MKKVFVLVGIAAVGAAAVALMRKPEIVQPVAPTGTWEPAERPA